jgi:hypothetical protein
MSKNISTIVIALLLCVSSLLAHAAPVQKTGKFSLMTSSANGASKNEREAAIQGAKVDVWNNYANTFNQSRLKQMGPRQAEILGNLDQFLSSVSVADEYFDKKTNTLTIAVSAQINEAKVDAYFSQMSTAGKAQSGDGSSMAFIFMARKQSSAKEFDLKRTKVKEMSASISSGEKSSDNSRSQGNGSSDSSSENTTITKTNKTVTGGSSERKADALVYEVTSSQDVDTSMADVFTSNGFEISSYSDIQGNCGAEPVESIQEDFAIKDDMTPPKRKKMMDAAMECNVRFMATGTIDIGAADSDPVSGNRRVFVSVRGQIDQLFPEALPQKKLPRRVASVGPVQFSATGANEKVAMINALNKAAKETAIALVDQLNAKGIH